MAISTQLQQLLRVLLPDKGFKTAGSHRDAIIAGVEESKTYTDEKAAEAVKKTGNETIGGVKTFTSAPVVPDATEAQHPVTLVQGVLKTQIKQTTGTSETDVMSQKAVTAQVEALNDGKVNTTDIEQVRSQATNKVTSSKLLDDELTAVDDSLVQLAGQVIYDVTKNNPTEVLNNDGKFESLSALLLDADLSTLIPSVVRCGGMSIRFVQSSDNKYVQFRYVGASTASADFTNVNNWQSENVDDTPIVGSKNLVTSGGVKEVVKTINDAINIRNTNLSLFRTGYSGYIGQDGNLVSLSSAYVSHFYVKSGYGLKFMCSQSNAPVTQAVAWAIYSSTTTFNDTTLLAKSNNNAKGSFTETFVVPNGAKAILVQRFYVGSANIEQLTNLSTDALDKIENTDIVVSKKKRSNVYLQDAIINTSLTDAIKNKVLDGILSLKVEGISGGNYIISKVSIVNYVGYYLTIDVSEIVSSSLVKVCSFIRAFSSMDNIVKIVGRVELSNKHVYNAECVVDLQKLGTNYFTDYDVTTVDTSTYRNYGVNPNCFINPVYKSVLPQSSYNRLRREFRRLWIGTLDKTREYLLKTFSYNVDSGYLSIELCTSDNFITVYQYNNNIGTSHTGIERIRLAGDNDYAELDFSQLKSNFSYSYTSNSIPDSNLFSVDIIRTDEEYILAENEMTLTLDGDSMKLLDCGVISKLFYLSCGNKIYSTKSIIKQHYTNNDIGNALTEVCSFPEGKISVEREYIEGINSLKELNNGFLIINVRVCYYTTDEKTEYGEYSMFYRYNGSTLNKLFDGSWGYHTLTSGVVKKGGRWTAVWDFDNYENLVFLSERCSQGLGGKAWMSKDGGITWNVIFNAFTYSNYNLYKVVQPSGWDSEHNDFARGIPGTPSYPYSNFHIHGIAYDRWRDRVYIVSGDASWVKGSYSAVWILNNPSSCSVYPASGDIPEGATNGNVKMLECDWTRIGLYNDENNLGKNLQFVSILPFENFIYFGTDSGGGGLNGIISNTHPTNFVATNFRIEYPLNADSENALTHCAGGVLKLNNSPYLWTFHREGSDFGPSSSDQKGCIMAIDYGSEKWRRVWIDDTLDSNRNTKISWGATMIGNESEMYLRYKGWGDSTNVIRRMLWKK